VYNYIYKPKKTNYDNDYIMALGPGHNNGVVLITEIIELGT